MERKVVGPTNNGNSKYSVIQNSELYPKVGKIKWEKEDNYIGIKKIFISEKYIVGPKID